MAQRELCEELRAASQQKPSQARTFGTFVYSHGDSHWKYAFFTSNGGALLVTGMRGWLDVGRNTDFFFGAESLGGVVRSVIRGDAG